MDIPNMPKMMDRSCDPLEIDKLTGLYTREAFLKYADEKIKNNPREKKYYKYRNSIVVYICISLCRC